jgi:two-component system response regulator RegA
MTDSAHPPERPLLLVDDDQVLRERLARAFRARGLEVRVAGDAAEALLLARRELPQRAVVDLRMPGRSGIDLARELHELDAEIQIVILTGYGSIATAVEAMRVGVVHYLAKPADADEILAAFAEESVAPAAPGEAASTPSLARAEWEHIQRVLSDCGGNVSEAARRLGLHRRSLQRKLGKLPPRG